jgi:hypothetical protein
MTSSLPWMEGTTMTVKPERTGMERMWRTVAVGMTVVVLLTALVVLVAT